jgi:small subunit ribosomal protein S27Ae
MAEEKEKKTSKKWEKYTVEGDTLKKNRTCPKCGPGVFMAEHKDRFACGKCGYMEKRGVEPKPEAKPEPKQESKPEVQPEPPKETPKEESPKEETPKEEAPAKEPKQ